MHRNTDTRLWLGFGLSVWILFMPALCPGFKFKTTNIQVCRLTHRSCSCWTSNPLPESLPVRLHPSLCLRVNLEAEQRSSTRPAQTPARISQQQRLGTSKRKRCNHAQGTINHIRLLNHEPPARVSSVHLEIMKWLEAVARSHAIHIPGVLHFPLKPLALLYFVLKIILIPVL